MAEKGLAAITRIERNPPSMLTQRTFIRSRGNVCTLRQMWISAFESFSRQDANRAKLDFLIDASQLPEVKVTSAAGEAVATA